MTINSSNRFVEELRNLIEYYRHEYDITYAEVTGCLEIVKHDLILECLEPSDEQEYPECDD